MKALIVTLLTCCLATIVCAEQPFAGAETYELYSWQTAKGHWNFSLFYTINRQKTVPEVLSHKSVLHGLDQLKIKISKLPASSTIVWFDRLTLSGVRLKGSEGLKYPSKETVEELRQYAKTRGIEISGPE